MALLDPVGILSVPLSKLRTMLSQSGTFQALRGAASAAEALDGIAYVTSEQTREPMLILNPASQAEQTLAGGSINLMGHTGTLLAAFLLPVSAAYQKYDAESRANAALEYLNALGGILDDLKALNGADGMLTLTRVELASPILRTPRELMQSEGDYHWAELSIDWD